MNAPLERALLQLDRFEGGTSDSPIDRGGFTHRGITQKLYDRWRVSHGMPKRPVVLIDDGERRALLVEYFWAPCRCDELPADLAIAVFDMAVNSGQGDAIRCLQVAVGARQDGAIGPETIAAAHRAAPVAALRFLKARGAHIQEVIADDPPQLGNLEGWINRLLDQAWRRA